MDYDQLIAIVEREADTSRAEAEQATRATLQTLAERITKGEARDLAQQLPDELIPWLFTNRAGQDFDADKFLRRLAAREHLDDDDDATAAAHAAAVFAALRRAIAKSELDDLASELPSWLRNLLTGVWIVTEEEFVAKVARVAGVDDDQARKATHAVLETLAERVGAGEADDLASHLPAELHPPRQRGRTSANGPIRMPAEEFVRRVAQREGATVDAARGHIEAVLAALRDTVPEEFYDIAVELPGDYDSLLPSPS
jgi:uncharacterized protein (DUF2267 family)